MAKLPKLPKKPKSTSSIETKKRWLERAKNVQKRRDEILRERAASKKLSEQISGFRLK